MYERETRKMQASIRRVTVLAVVAALLFIAGASEAQEGPWSVIALVCPVGARPSPQACPQGMVEQGLPEYASKAECLKRKVALEAKWDMELRQYRLVTYPACMPSHEVKRVMSHANEFGAAPTWGA